MAEARHIEELEDKVAIDLVVRLDTVEVGHVEVDSIAVAVVACRYFVDLDSTSLQHRRADLGCRPCVQLIHTVCITNASMLMMLPKDQLMKIVLGGKENKRGMLRLRVVGK